MPPVPPVAPVPPTPPPVPPTPIPPPTPLLPTPGQLPVGPDEQRLIRPFSSQDAAPNSETPQQPLDNDGPGGSLHIAVSPVAEQVISVVQMGEALDVPLATMLPAMSFQTYRVTWQLASSCCSYV